MKIFITGASGFVGGAIARKLGPHHTLMGMARSAAAVEKVKANDARPIQVTFDKLTHKNLAYCEAVIHCAAFVEPYGTRQQFWDVNVEGTRTLLAAAREAGVKRFIHMGTEAALFYGQDMVDIDETYPYPDKTPFYYSETKAEAEKLVLEANEPGVFETISLRPRLVWGPNDTTILKNLLEMVDKGRFRWIDGGKYMTSTTHIDNIVHATELALTRGVGGEAYFITDREIHMMKEFITMYLKTAGREPQDKNAPSWFVRAVARVVEGFYRLFRIRRKPPVTRFAAAIMSSHFTVATDKAERELGYEPVIGVKDGMNAMTEWEIVD